MKNWKTTALGVLTVLAAVSNAGIALLNGQHFDIGLTLTSITSGVGLIAAKDHSAAPTATSNPAAPAAKP